MTTQYQQELEEIPARVASGIAWLQAHRPNEISLICSQTLDISCGDSCVIGQLDGDFNDSSFAHSNENEAINLGFYRPNNLSKKQQHRYYLRLTATWKEQLLQLRHAA